MSILLKETKKYQASSSVKRKEPSTSKESMNKNSNHFQDISNMHESIGNKAVGRLLSSTGIQAKLTVSQPSDSFEIEAEKVADKVMSMKDTNITARSPIQIQRKITNSNSNQELSPNTESRINSLQNNGQSLSKQTRSFFEPRFGHDFSNVKIHTDSNANSLASSINARAFTKGNNIVFNKGEYNPQSNKGKKLLGHELTHTIQQYNTQSTITQRKEETYPFNRNFSKQKNTLYLNLYQFINSKKYFDENNFFDSKEFLEFYKLVVTYNDHIITHDELREKELSTKAISFKSILNLKKENFISDIINTYHKIQTPIHTDNIEVSVKVKVKNLSLKNIKNLSLNNLDRIMISIKINF